MPGIISRIGSSDSAVVEESTRDSKFKGLNPATPINRREIIVKRYQINYTQKLPSIISMMASDTDTVVKQKSYEYKFIGIHLVPTGTGRKKIV
jgi:hypothetical protein